MKSIAISLVFFLFMTNSYGQQTAQKLTTPEGHTIEYLQFLPDDYDGKKTYPLMIFLHGAGEKGNDLEKVKVHGPPKFVEKNPNFPAVIISPQCPKGERWSSEKIIFLLNKLYNHIVENFNVDKKTVILTGLSMGGNGTFVWANENPEKFKTIVPICGWANNVDVKNYKNHRVWVFHGAKDQVVTPQSSVNLVDKLRKEDQWVGFTLYPDATHNSWTETYNNTSVLEWMLEPFYGEDFKIDLH